MDKTPVGVINDPSTSLIFLLSMVPFAFCYIICLVSLNSNNELCVDDGNVCVSSQDNCKMAHIPGFTYPVQELYLEEIIEKTG